MKTHEIVLVTKRYGTVTVHAQVAETAAEFKRITDLDLLTVGNAYYLNALKNSLNLAGARKRKELDLSDESAVENYVDAFKLKVPGGKKRKTKKYQEALTPDEQAQYEALMAKVRASGKAVAERSVTEDEAEDAEKTKPKRGRK